MKYIKIALILFWFFSHYIIAQKNVPADTQLKAGFSWGVIPALSYDSDLGIKYGAIINLFDFGNGKNYPAYEQYLYLKFTNTTKKTSQLQALLESEKIIKNALTMIEAAFFVDKKLDFFGFNGTKAYFNNEYIKRDSPQFINRTFYSYQRKYLRLRFDIQKFLSNKKYRFMSGVSYHYYKIDQKSFEIDKISNLYNNLYSNYLQWSIIPKNEVQGGSLLNFTLGFIFDTRNDKFFCTDGIWFETLLVFSPAWFGTDSYLKSVLTYRYYKGLIANKVSFSTRFSIQNKLFGKIPFYNLSTYYDSRLNQEGIGGAYTLRGAMRNRIIADGFALANIELKAEIYKFRFIKQDFMTALSFFTDISYVIQNYDVDLSKVPAGHQNTFFNIEKQRPGFSYGPGFYLIFNKNNVISVYYGFSQNKQLGNSGLYVGSSLLF